MGSFIQVIAVACGVVLLFGVWQLRKPHRYFTIELRDGEPRATQGHVSVSTICLIREVAKFNSVRDGQLWAVPGPSGMRLEFSKSFNDGARQQLRNSWGAMGWKTRPTASAKY